MVLALLLNGCLGTTKSFSRLAINKCVESCVPVLPVSVPHKRYKPLKPVTIAQTLLSSQINHNPWCTVEAAFMPSSSLEEVPGIHGKGPNWQLGSGSSKGSPPVCLKECLTESCKVRVWPTSESLCCLITFPTYRLRISLLEVGLRGSLGTWSQFLSKIWFENLRLLKGRTILRRNPWKPLGVFQVGL